MCFWEIPSGHWAASFFSTGVDLGLLRTTTDWEQRWLALAREFFLACHPYQPVGLFAVGKKE